MALVGELIVRARNAASDPCFAMQQPFAPSLSTAGAGTLTGTLYGMLTWLNQFGETIASNEMSIAGLSSNRVEIGLVEVPLAATSGRFYYSMVSGREEQYVVVNVTGLNYIGAVGQTALVGVPPYKPSAFLPDSDGDQISAFEIYRWINAGLTKLGRLAGGILDQTGVAMPANNAEVPIPGFWLRFIAVWHNGWLTLPEQQNYTWLQAPVSGIPGIVTLWKCSAEQVVGTWPQPATPPAATFLTLPMGPTDTVATVENTADFHGTDGVMLLNGTNLYSPTGGFSGNLVGLNITVAGAGPGATDLTTTVAAFVDQNDLTLANPAATAVAAAVFDITGSGSPAFTAPGMCQIDNEIMSYSGVSDYQLTGLVRGYGGTIATSHAPNAPVLQLILRILGRRMPVPLVVGQSANTIDMPQGWDEAMDYYLASKYAQTNNQAAEALSLMQEFEAKAIELRDDQIPSESKQVGGLWPLGGAAETLADVMDTVIIN